MFQNTWCTELKIFKIYLDLRLNKKVEILRTNDKSTGGKNSKAYHICQAMKSSGKIADPEAWAMITDYGPKE